MTLTKLASQRVKREKPQMGDLIGPFKERKASNKKMRVKNWKDNNRKKGSAKGTGDLMHKNRGEQLKRKREAGVGKENTLKITWGENLRASGQAFPGGNWKRDTEKSGSSGEARTSEKHPHGRDCRKDSKLYMSCGGKTKKKRNKILDYTSSKRVAEKKGSREKELEQRRGN